MISTWVFIGSSKNDFIQIKKQAAMMAQKPISRTGSGSISASGFLPAQVCKLVLSSTTNSNEVAPNAVIQLNKNNNRNEEQAATEVRFLLAHQSE